MLSHVTLKNFQAHRNLTVELGPGVTTVVGPSDVGKSALVRAVRWACLNKPDGLAFVRHGKKLASTTLHVDGCAVKRSRSKSKNAYSVSGAGSGTYKAFGRGNVPKPVEELLNVGPDNFQGQHDAPFWLALPAGDLSKALNDVVDLSLIDSSLEHLNRERRRTDAEASVCRQRLEEAQAERAELRKSKLMDRELKRLEKLSREAKGIRDRAEALATASCGLRGARRQLGRLDARVRRSEAVVVDLGAIFDGLSELHSRAKLLRQLIGSATAARAELNRAAGELSDIESELANYEECPACRRPIRSRS